VGILFLPLCASSLGLQIFNNFHLLAVLLYTLGNNLLRTLALLLPFVCTYIILLGKFLSFFFFYVECI